MVEFKAVISDPRDGKSYNKVIAGQHANSLIGKRIDETVDGIFVELPGYKLVLTGGSDKDGTPMRGDLPGPRRKRLLIAESTGFHPKDNGVRRRKMLRGNTVSPDTVQLNFRISAFGPRKLDELLAAGGEGEEKKE